jgi:hypothetical protein
MKNKVLISTALTLLVIVFTVALTFVTIEAPRVLNRFIRETFDVPDIHPVIEPELVEEFMRSNHVSLIGYSCLAVVILLIVVGFTILLAHLWLLCRLHVLPGWSGCSSWLVWGC